MRTTFINTLIELAKNDDRIVLLTADLGFSVFEKFEKEFPDRFYNIGISEQNMVGIASGLAIAGKKVYVYSIVPFITMRAFEQVRIDICYHNLDVKLIGVGGGLAYGPAGATHHAIEDISIMRSLPNMTVLAPGDPYEAKQSILETYKIKTPSYIRLSKNGEPLIHENTENLKFEIGKSIMINEGNEILLLTTGNMLEQANEIYKDIYRLTDKKIGFYSFPTIKPIDKEMILKISKKYKYIVTLEEHSIIGGLYSSISEVLMKNNLKEFKLERIIPFAIEDKFSHCVGSQMHIRKCYNLDKESIITEILKINKIIRS